jgi:hypothetical protein
LGYKYSNQNSIQAEEFMLKEMRTVIPESRVKWLEERIPNLVVRNIGQGIHYLQGNNPESIENCILDWSAKIA